MIKIYLPMFLLCIFTTVFAHVGENKISKNLSEAMSIANANDEILIWVFFTDKGDNITQYYSNPLTVVSEKSLKRRAKVLNAGNLILEMDLPVNQNYIERLNESGFFVKQKSKWFNGVSGYFTNENIAQLAQLEFVKKMDIVKKFKASKTNPELENNSNNNSQGELNKPGSTNSFNYGQSFTQLNQINVPAVHDMDYSGQGITICSMDAGFDNLSHEVFSSMNIIAMWDFVDNDPDVSQGGSHGTSTLSTLGGFKEGKLIGPAFGSDFILARTEDIYSETPVEEDNWIAALEWADSIGVDLTTTSLTYLEFDPPFQSYTWEDMDGNTMMITIAADLAVKLGIFVVNSASNEGFHPTRNTLWGPADGDSVIAVGSVDSNGDRSGFSSVGPTVDGRIKPDLMAMGEGVYVARSSSSTSYGYSNGTSFSCPILAGAAALLLEIDPSLTPIQLRELLKNTASQSNNPDRLMGWGIINTLDAAELIIVPADPTFFTATAISDSQIDIAFTPNANDNNVVIVWNLTGTFTIPSGLPPSPGQPFAGGTLLYNGTTSPVIHTSLNELITYYYKAFSNDNINYSSGIEVNATTLETIATFQLTVSILDGWNVVSIPGNHPDGNTVDNWWPYRDSLANVFLFNNGYQAVDTLSPGVGYWLKHLGSRVYNTCDEWPCSGIIRVPHDPISANAGWNMIGVYEDTLATAGLTTTPPGLISGSVFEYSEGYMTATNLVPGYGYWIRLTGAGNINIPPGPLAKGNGEVVEYIQDDWGKITITDNAGRSSTLYAVNGKVNLDKYELPPMPPVGMFDIRYDSDRIAEDINSAIQTIKMTSLEYPITVQVDGMDIRLQDETGNQIDENIKSGEQITISNTSINKLMVTGEMIPDVYSLEQNYPNPFNPSTTIEFSLPEDVSNVQLTIYDILGQRIAQLVNTSLKAGKYNYQWDARNVSTGMYIYELRTNSATGGFVSVKKMILLK